MAVQGDTDRGAGREVLGLSLNEDTRPRGPSVGDLPLKITEERLLAESQRNPHVTTLDKVPLVPAGAAEGGQTPQHGRGPGLDGPFVDTARRRLASGQPRTRSSASLPNQPNRCGSILNLSDGELDQLGTSVVPNPEERHDESGERFSRVRSARSSRPLWGVIIVLIVALTTVTTYDYLAMRQHSVITSQLPGAGVVAKVRAETEGARFKIHEFEQGNFSAQVVALERKARPALAAASRHAQGFMAGLRDRFQRWRATR